MALFVTLVITASFAVFCGSPCNSVLTVAAQAPPANATVTNNVTVTASSISLGSTVQATGKVTVGTTPLANAAVSLHMGDVILADTQTNGNGEYSFAAPVGVYYFPAAFLNGATIYTVVEPGNASLTNAPSAVTTVSVDLLPLYLIVAAVTAAILIWLYLIARRMRGKAALRPLGRRRAKPAEQTASKPAQASRPEASVQNPQELAGRIAPAADAMAEAPALEPALQAKRAAPLLYEGPQMAEPQPSASRETPPESVAETGLLKRAHDIFGQGDEGQGQTDWAVEIDGLAKSYGSTKAVDHISFSIPIGVIFAFLGPNGAGKTTTIEMLECLRKPSAGAAYVLGLDITKDQNEIRKRIGVLPQEFNTFDRLTVRESLKYYAAMYENSRDIDELIVSVDLADQANTQHKNLSGGLKQRVGVAIALVNDPEVVFLDEPTEGLDPKSRRRVWEIITKLRDEGKTVFLTTHYMEEAETLADIVAIILDGKIKAMDKTANLINNHGLRTKIVIQGGGTEALEALGTRWKGTELNNGNVIVPMSDKKDLVRIAELLDQHQVAFDDLEIRKPSLEDVFLELTRAHEEATS